MVRRLNAEKHSNDGHIGASLTHDDDHVLAKAAMCGDTAAFEALVLRYRQLVLGIARRLTGDADSASDVVQQTFMKAFAKLSTFQFRSSFSTWLISIARNEAMMWHRSARRSREVPIVHGTSTGETSAMDFPDWRSDPEQLYCKKELYQLLFSAISRLSPDARAAIEMADLDEQSNNAVALHLGISVTSLKSRRVRGRASLRRKLRYLLPHDDLLATPSEVPGSALHSKEDINA
jgi:RNA polymerase sigma-70 factor (ECF subfamily)